MEDDKLIERDVMTHFELCKLTAERFIKDIGNNIALYEYSSFVSGEQPDVLIYGNTTILFEIKMSKLDFLHDKQKEARIKYKVRYGMRRDLETRNMYYRSIKIEKRWNEKPHLGYKRFYVCPWGMIQSNELENTGWGLYWLRGKRFFKQKESKNFVRNIHNENRLLSHAFRKYGNIGCDTNIIIKPY